MRYKIEYFWDPNTAPYHCAKSEVNGEFVVSCENSWELVRARHLGKLSEISPAPGEIPMPEEIEL
jgi:hypothetical protein